MATLWNFVQKLKLELYSAYVKLTIVTVDIIIITTIVFTIVNTTTTIIINIIIVIIIRNIYILYYFNLFFKVLLETEISDLSWNSVAVGRSYDPAFNIGFMKSFEMRKLKIANFNAPEDGIHTLMEKGKSGVFCTVDVFEFLYLTIANFTSTVF